MVEPGAPDLRNLYVASRMSSVRAPSRSAEPLRLCRGQSSRSTAAALGRRRRLTPTYIVRTMFLGVSTTPDGALTAHGSKAKRAARPTR